MKWGDISFRVRSSFFKNDCFERTDPTSLSPLTYNKELKIFLSSILIYLLYHKHCEATAEGNDVADYNFFHFINISCYVGKSLILLGLMYEFE